MICKPQRMSIIIIIIIRGRERESEGDTVYIIIYI